jgi:hypothetical protein
LGPDDYIGESDVAFCGALVSEKIGHSNAYISFYWY